MTNWDVVPSDESSHLYLPLIFALKGYGCSDNPKGFYLDKFLDELPFEVGGEPGWFIRPVEEGYLIWNSLVCPNEKVYSKTEFLCALKKILSAYIENFPEEEVSVWNILNNYFLNSE
ncbi:hypothetical protein [Marinomonas sp. THO17]|uniref:hypothetical protein n=1 Tax=Marinomonas sp. THO17 TaxID=3149048 RepID=UPI00336BE722